MLLAIDTSTGTSTAVVDRDRSSGELRLLAERTSDDPMRHAEVIGDFIAEVLDEAGIAPAALSGVAVGMGPGPYTGLRVGIAAARAFAIGIERPMVPVPSHDAIALGWYLGGGTGRVQLVTDARRREFAVSEFDGLDAERLPRRRSGPALFPREQVPAFDGTRLDVAAVSAGSVGFLAELAFAAGRLPLADEAPIYLREPDVTPSAGKRVTR